MPSAEAISPLLKQFMSEKHEYDSSDEEDGEPQFTEKGEPINQRQNQLRKMQEYFKTKRSMHKYQSFLILKSINVMKGVHKLKLLLKKHQLSKQNFIYTLKFKGNARVPDELKITRYPLSYQFYDPIPEIVDKYTRKYFHKEKTMLLKHQAKNQNIIQRIFKCISPTRSTKKQDEELKQQKKDDIQLEVERKKTRNKLIKLIHDVQRKTQED